MLEYNIIEKKPTVKTNNDEYIDLLADVYKINDSCDPTVIIVNKYYVARPDLISFAVYGDDKYADIICKVNGISNPFEINENDIIILPNLEWLSECYANNITVSDFVKDEDKDFIQRKDNDNYQKRINEPRSPNEQLYGESNYVIDKSLGIVFY